jgi:hypothetical protein
LIFDTLICLGSNMIYLCPREKIYIWVPKDYFEVVPPTMTE